MFVTNQTAKSLFLSRRPTCRGLINGYAESTGSVQQTGANGRDGFPEVRDGSRNSRRIAEREVSLSVLGGSSLLAFPAQNRKTVTHVQCWSS